MWAVDNRTPFSAERAFVRDRDGAEVWLVAVRATFDIGADGELRLSARQDPVAVTPQYLGELGKSSLRCDSELHRTKPGTDVIVNGSAHAPGVKPAPVVQVSLAVGPIRKTLTVKGDRRYVRRMGVLVPSSPEPFTRMPITYERACGGADPSAGAERASLSAQNPVGVGLREEEGAPLPNVEPPDGGLRPAGLGAISCDWTPRRRLAGTFDEVWRAERQPLLPLDFDDAYFHAAPEDQRVPGYLRGDEQVTLVGMTPGGVLRFRLPRPALGWRTLVGGGLVHHRGVLHTVLIEPDEARVILVWHSALPCHHDLYSLQRTVVFEKELFSSFERRGPPEDGP